MKNSGKFKVEEKTFSDKILEEFSKETKSKYPVLHDQMIILSRCTGISIELMYKKNISLPITEAVGKQIVTIPIHPNLKKSEIQKIIKCVNDSA